MIIQIQRTVNEQQPGKEVMSFLHLGCTAGYMMAESYLEDFQHIDSVIGTAGVKIEEAWLEVLCRGTVTAHRLHTKHG